MFVNYYVYESENYYYYIITIYFNICNKFIVFVERIMSYQIWYTTYGTTMNRL